MTKEHYNELIDLSQKIYDQATDHLTNYCAAKYCGIGNDTTEQQLEDYLFVAQETSAFLLGNALALLDAESQEQEIRSFVENLRTVIAAAIAQTGGGNKPS